MANADPRAGMIRLFAAIALLSVVAIFLVALFSTPRP